MRSRRTGDGIVAHNLPRGLEVIIPPCATGFAVLSVLALGFLSACGANDGQVSEDRPSATTSLSPTRTFPSPTRSPEAPDQTKPESPRPSRSSALPPDTTTPDN